MFSGVIISLLTPFTGAEVDESTFAACVDFQAAEGVAGLLTGGIAGEGPTLSPAERYRLARIAVEVADRRVPVFSAAGTNSTAASVEQAREAKAAGVCAVILVTPYYNKPSQEGIFRHVEAVARAVDIPIVVENAPGRTNVEIAPGMLERLASLPAVVGLIDGTADLQRMAQNAEACGARLARLAPREDAARLGMPPLSGCLSIAANIAPRLCIAAWDEEPARAALAAHAGTPGQRVRTLYRALDSEAEPVAAKYALSLLRPGFDPHPRLPLTPAREESCAMVRVALSRLAGDLAPMPSELAAPERGDLPALII